jgi:hypothetical protein
VQRELNGVQRDCVLCERQPHALRDRRMVECCLVNNGGASFCPEHVSPLTSSVHSLSRCQEFRLVIRIKCGMFSKEVLVVTVQGSG